MSAQARALLAALSPDCFGFDDGPVAVALSGGGDSLALLALAAERAAETRAPLLAVTVDHGLRPESAAEAAQAGALAATLGVPHTVLRWPGWDGQGNLQDRARRARRRMLENFGLAAAYNAVAIPLAVAGYATPLMAALAMSTSSICVSLNALRVR